MIATRNAAEPIAPAIMAWSDCYVNHKPVRRARGGGFDSGSKDSPTLEGGDHVELSVDSRGFVMGA